MTTPESSQMPGQLVICTIISKNYLAQARALMETVARHHPEAERVVLLVDEVDGYFDPAAENFMVLLAHDLDIPRWPNFFMRYDILELNTAVKPYYLERLFEDYQAAKVIYLDPDILIFNPFTAVLELLDNHMSVLTPHILQPLDDGYHPTELDLLRVGTFNLGFFAISRQGEWRELLHWWQQKLYDQGYNDVPNGMFVDQRWIELAPSLFASVSILRDPTYNIAYWNFKKRDLQQDAQSYTVNGQPLTFFHFSGFEPYKLEQVSRHQNRYQLSDLSPAFRAIMEDYAQCLLAHDYETIRSWPYKYGIFSDGIPIMAYHRICLRQQDADGERWENPFDSRSADNFRDWCVTPHADQRGLLSPYMLAIYAVRSDLQKIFPDIVGRDQLPFARWFVEQENSSPIFHTHTTQPIRKLLDKQRSAPHIIAESKTAISNTAGRWSDTWDYYRDFPEKILPYIPANALEVQTEFYTGPGGLYGGARRLFKRLGILQTLRRVVGLRVIMTARFFFAYHAEAWQSPAVVTPRTFERGVNVIGYMDAGSGVGQAARNILMSLLTTDFPVGVVTLELSNHAPHESQPVDWPEANRQFRLNIFHANADATYVVRQTLDPRIYDQHYNIGFWFWEIEHFPERWEKCFAAYHEIWAATAFVQQAISAISPVPVIHMPLPIEVVLSEEITRSDLNLPEDCFLYLFIFDAHSIIARKNPWAVIEAFRQVFSEQERQQAVRLVIKASNLSAYPEDAKKLRAAVNTVNAILIERYFTRAETNALLNSCDSYVSLHRSEGYGLTIAEAMYLGKPVIATAYSGNMDFMTMDNSFAVPYQLVKLEEDYPPYEAGNVWAEPDVVAAARLMRLVYDQPEEARRRAQRAAAHLREHYHPAKIGQKVKARLEGILRNHGELK